MSTKKFLETVEKSIKRIESLYEEETSEEDLEVIQVWYCKTIQNHKGLFIVREKNIDLIYPYFIEATYNGDEKEIYLDFYSKQFKVIVNCDEQKEKSL